MILLRVIDGNNWSLVKKKNYYKKFNAISAIFGPRTRVISYRGETKLRKGRERRCKYRDDDDDDKLSWLLSINVHDTIRRRIARYLVIFKSRKPSITIFPSREDCKNKYDRNWHQKIEIRCSSQHFVHHFPMKCSKTRYEKTSYPLCTRIPLPMVHAIEKEQIILKIGISNYLVRRARERWQKFHRLVVHHRDELNGP